MQRRNYAQSTLEAAQPIKIGGFIFKKDLNEIQFEQE